MTDNLWLVHRPPQVHDIEDLKNHSKANKVGMLQSVPLFHFVQGRVFLVWRACAPSLGHSHCHKVMKQGL